MRSSIVAGLVPLASAGVLTKHHTTTTTEWVNLVPTATAYQPHSVVHKQPHISEPTAFGETTILQEPTFADPEPPVVEQTTYISVQTVTPEPTILPATTIVPQPTVIPEITVVPTAESTAESMPQYRNPDFGNKRIVKNSDGVRFHLAMAPQNDIGREALKDVVSAFEAMTGFETGVAGSYGAPLQLSNPVKDIWAPTVDPSDSTSSVWTLKKGDLITSGEPSSDKFHMRIAENEKDGFQVPVATTNAHKNHLAMYHNAKLQGNRDWQLKKDSASGHYHLQNNDDKGSFYWCDTPSPAFPGVSDALLFTHDIQNLPAGKCVPVVLAAYEQNY